LAVPVSELPIFSWETRTFETSNSDLEHLAMLCPGKTASFSHFSKKTPAAIHQIFKKNYTHLANNPVSLC
jgi:hypothetical protein